MRQSRAESLRSARVSIKVECTSCGATGVYCGFAEPEGTGVVCLACDGTGAQTLSGRTFIRRKRRMGVRTVSRSRGSFLATGVGATGDEVSYKDFISGKMPR